MKIMTIFGTRPEIIRLSLILKVLDQHCEHITVNTGESNDANLSDTFIRDLDIRKPHINLGIGSETFGERAGQILSKIDEILEKQKPDRLLVLGGTNSSLASLAAVRRRIPVFHMEAGNRCYDNSVPDEVNRRTVDHASTVLLPYTNNSKQNLLREGIAANRIFTTGNPIKEVIDTFAPEIESSEVMATLGVRPFDYFLVTIQKAENVNDEERLRNIFYGISLVAAKFGKQIIVTAHSRTAQKIEQYLIEPTFQDIKILPAMNFFDFIKLEKNSLAVLTDSGTVQEECCIFGVPNITLRDVTDRPETIECGSNVLSGTEPEAIVRAVEIAIAQPAAWTPPREYMVSNVSQTVSRILLGYVR